MINKKYEHWISLKGINTSRNTSKEIFLEIDNKFVRREWLQKKNWRKFLFASGSWLMTLIPHHKTFPLKNTSFAWSCRLDETVVLNRIDISRNIAVKHIFIKRRITKTGIYILKYLNFKFYFFSGFGWAQSGIPTSGSAPS